MANRLFTAEELRALALPGAARVQQALTDTGAAHAQQVFDHVLDQYRRFHTLYHGWTASLFAFLDARWGHEVTRNFTRIEGVLAHSARAGMSLDAIRVIEEKPAEMFAGKLGRGDFAGAYEFYLEVERGCRALHDFYRDYVATILSQVYCGYGIDALADCLRASSEKDWMPWMMAEVDSDPRARLVVWADLLGVGNFGSITIEEQDDCFVVTQNPCGSCGRQHRGGRYEEPWNLSIVTERDHPLTYGQGGCTAYRAHIPMMHYIMPMERIGAPWPLIQCPRNTAGRCRVTIYKDPRHPVAAADARWSD